MSSRIRKRGFLTPKGASLGKREKRLIKGYE
jgi:hypothetical protein